MEKIVQKIRRSFGYDIMILPYTTYGTKNMAYLRGRVLEDKNIQPKKDDTIYHLLKNTYKRFWTDEKENVVIKASFEGNEFVTTTNQEGYFRIREKIDPLELDEDQHNWVSVGYTMEGGDAEAVSQMLVPQTGCDFGIISDIDDTVLQTGVTSFLKLKVIYNSLLKSAFDREPLQGASPFYQSLEKGTKGTNSNPFFYISNSPWNLYNYLRMFLREKQFPAGPVLLRDFAMPWESNYQTEKNHKQREIRNIFLTYPNMKFIMFGDSAEHDASIYSEVAREFPEQVICIYLHAVNKKRQMEYVNSVIDGSEHVEMVLASSALEMAEHAFHNDLITKQAYHKVLAKVQKK